MQMLFLKWISRLEYYKLPLYCGLKERRQFMCFLITTFAELVFIPANLLGLNDYLEPHVFDALNWFQLAFLVVLQVAFWRNWVSIRTALYVFFIEICLKISFESLFQAISEGGGESRHGQLLHHPHHFGCRPVGEVAAARLCHHGDTYRRLGDVLLPL